MYFVYFFLVFNVVLVFYSFFIFFGNVSFRMFVGKIFVKFKLVVVSFGFVVLVIVGFVCIGGMYIVYYVLLFFYDLFFEVGGWGDIVCFGKDWYCFFILYFFFKDMYVKFVCFEFCGLFFGEFSEVMIGFGFFGGIWLFIIGLNNKNEEDMGKYVDLRMCVFMVDM